MINTRGRYIALVGGDAVGKTTQTELLIKILDEHGIKAVAYEEPGGSLFGRELRKIIKFGPERTPLANLLAFSAARADSLTEVEVILDDGTWVIADRTFLSSIVYQGYGEGLSIDNARSISELAVGNRTPDLMFVLDMEVKESLNRWGKRGSTDYFEKLDIAFFERVHEGYRKEANREGYPVIDASKNITSVHQLIWNHIKNLL